MTKHLPRDRYECRVLTFHCVGGTRWLVDRFECPIDHWELNNIYDLNAFQTAKKLYRLVQEHQIDIVHSFHQTSDLWAAPIAKLAGAKVLISSRRDMGILRKARHDIGYRVVQGVFDQIQTVSEGVRQFVLRKDKADPERTITVYTGIEPDVELEAAYLKSVRQQFDLPVDRPVVITVANCRHVKGTDVLVQAAAMVGKEFPNVQFLSVGLLGGNDQDIVFAKDLEKLKDSVGATPYIRFLGRTVEEVPALLSLSNIFVLPSRSEGLSNALLEAMRAGLPCIATQVGGNPEVVVDGETGFLVPSENPREMADKLLTLLRNPKMQADMGRAGRRRLLEKFTIEAMTSQLMTNYEQELDKKQPKIA
jgi:glycosyltransferase involved in cell wall biosynthesis